MAISGLTGFIFFVVCNFLGLPGAIGIALAQIAINIFVHRSWWRGYQESNGLAHLVAGIGAVVPVVMASITTLHVLLPALGRWLGGQP